ncbi:hypothetical protein F8S13_22115 [Chloroflexia bacterium SDU3-3]|nr:hypothetical protein F8S13_22115 [Chloroflexia bacterium SDU3-3]
MFYQDHEGTYTTSAALTPHALAALPAGVYRATVGARVTFTPVALAALPPTLVETPARRIVGQELTALLDERVGQRLRAAGLPRRRGVLIAGAPGSGKTTLLAQLIVQLVAGGAVVILDPNPDHLERGVIPAIRQHDPGRMVAVVWEDFEGLAWAGGNELLQLLDGLTSPDDLIVLGTATNLTRVPARLLDRPSRIGLVVTLQPPEAQALSGAVGAGVLGRDAQLDLAAMTAGLPLMAVQEAATLFALGYEADEVRDRLIVAAAGWAALAAREVRA